MQTQLKVKLSFFNFLQYFIWGSWYVSMGAYLANTLKFGGQEIGAAYGAFAIGSMISPFFVGLLADRYFSSEKIIFHLEPRRVIFRLRVRTFDLLHIGNLKEIP